MVSRFDRAAPHGTGHVKAGGNYAASFHPGAMAKEHGFIDAYRDLAKRYYAGVALWEGTHHDELDRHGRGAPASRGRSV